MHLIREARESLGAVRALGPFFAVDVDPPQDVWDRWQSADVLVAHPEVLRSRAEATRSLLASASGLGAEAVDARTAASLTGLGLVARFVSPLLGAFCSPGFSR